MSNLSYNKWYEWTLGLIVLLMTVLPRLLGVGVLILFIVSVIGVVKKKLSFRFNKLGVLFFFLYVAYLIGTFYTNNPDVANKYLEYKLSFLLFPILFSVKLNDKLSIRIPLTVLIGGILILGFLGLINCVPLYIEKNNINYLFSSHFSYIHHPTYLSVFAAFASVVLIYGYKLNWRGYSLFNTITCFFSLLAVQLLCLSLAGVLFLLAYLFVIAIVWSYTKLSRKLFFATLIAGVGILFAVVKYTPDVNTQFVNSANYLSEYLEDPEEFFRSKQTYVGGSETRLIMWAASSQVFMEHPYGVGTGNVDDFLTNKLNEIGQPHMAVKKLNPHNQYLQTAVEIGVIGLLLLIIISILGIYNSVKNKNWLLLFIVISLTFNCLFESMLQRQSGIVFYTFWICLLIVYYPDFSNKQKT